MIWGRRNACFFPLGDESDLLDVVLFKCVENG